MIMGHPFFLPNATYLFLGIPILGLEFAVQPKPLLLFGGAIPAAFTASCKEASSFFSKASMNLSALSPMRLRTAASMFSMISTVGSQSGGGTALQDGNKLLDL